MAEDLLPLLGHNLEDEDDNPSDSDEESMDEEVRDVEDDTTDEEEDPQENEEEEERRPIQASNINFDVSLPGEHSYLGNDLEEIHGRTIHDDDSYLTLPLLSLPGVVLIPGQTLPLRLSHPATVAMVRNIVQNDKTFGLVNSRYEGRDFTPTLAPIGTTAEIFSVKEETDDASGISVVRVKAMGRQRFEVKETRNRVDGTLMAKVRILPERVMPRTLEGIRPQSHSRSCGCYQEELFTQAVASGDASQILRQALTVSNRHKKVNRFTCANMTWWPPWVYQMYDVYGLMKKMKLELQSWNETLKPENMPPDPTDFSFWVAGNLPLDDRMKIHLLGIDCSIQRLRCELSIMQRCTVLCCKDCELLIANKKDVFSMALQGPLGAYVNPGGHVHETLTVYKAQGLNLVGRPSTENSWFPGYAWTILECRHCTRHMGWKFTAVKKKLQPEKFWGLCRSALLPGLQNKDEKEDFTESWMPIM